MFNNVLKSLCKFWREKNHPMQNSCLTNFRFSCFKTLGWIQWDLADEVNIWSGAIRQQAITWANVDILQSPYDVTRPQWVKTFYNNIGHKSLLLMLPPVSQIYPPVSVNPIWVEFMMCQYVLVCQQWGAAQPAPTNYRSPQQRFPADSTKHSW